MFRLNFPHMFVRWRWEWLREILNCIKLLQWFENARGIAIHSLGKPSISSLHVAREYFDSLWEYQRCLASWVLQLSLRRVSELKIPKHSSNYNCFLKTFTFRIFKWACSHSNAPLNTWNVWIVSNNSIHSFTQNSNENKCMHKLILKFLFFLNLSSADIDDSLWIKIECEEFEMRGSALH